MGITDDARPHLEKADEYLRAAHLVLAAGLANAACSLAVTSGINASDVICLLSIGRTSKGERHDAAVSALRRSGPVGDTLAPTLERLLAKKTKSQYSPASVSRADAEDATKRSTRLFEAAQELFRSTPR